MKNSMPKRIALATAASTMLMATPALAKPWIVGPNGPIAPVESCIIVEGEDGFHHMANGHELPSGYKCDNIGAANGGGDGQVNIRDVKKAHGAKMNPRIKPVRPKGCRNGDKCPAPAPERPRR